MKSALDGTCTPQADHLFHSLKNKGFEVSEVEKGYYADGEDGLGMRLNL